MMDMQVYIIHTYITPSIHLVLDVALEMSKKRCRDGVMVLLYAIIPALPAYCHTYTLFLWFLALPSLYALYICFTGFSLYSSIIYICS